MIFYLRITTFMLEIFRAMCGVNLKMVYDIHATGGGGGGGGGGA